MTGDVVAVPAFWDADDPAAGGLDGLQVAGLEHLPCCPVRHTRGSKGGVFERGKEAHDAGSLDDGRG